MFEYDGSCGACGVGFSDKFGDHAIGCASQGERIARHNHLRDALFHTAQSATLAPLREERALLPGVAGDRRPADVLLPNYAGGRPLEIDVSVVSSLQVQLIARAAEEAGHALDHRYQEKWRKYGELCAAEGIVFQPLPVEVLGGWHEAAVGHIKKLGQALARSTGQDACEVVRHLFGRLSVLLMKGNSQLALTHRPSHPAPPVLGIL